MDAQTSNPGEAPPAPAAAPEQTPASFDPFARIHDRIDQVEKKIEQLGEFVGHLVGRLEEKIAPIKPAIAAAAAAVELVAPSSKAAEVAEQIADYVPCPNHPDAPQTDNRCNAPLCDWRGR